MTCSIIMLVMVAIGINSALVMVALVLNRTACRRPGLRDDNYSYRPASLDGDNAWLSEIPHLQGPPYLSLIFSSKGIKKNAARAVTTLLR